MILGIDFGSSTTDIVLVNKRNVVKHISIATDEFTNKILNDFPNISTIAVTGSRHNKLTNKPIIKVDEIKAIGLGGLHVAKTNNALVVSIGSGTCMVSCRDNKFTHIGGTPIGGRTLTGLSKLLIGANDCVSIEKLGKKGNLNNIDLTMKKIYPKGIGILPATATASHFGDIKNPSKHDKALALLNMTAQTIATLAVFAAKAFNHKNIILTGKLTKLSIFKDIIQKRINRLSKIPVTIPKHSEYATAIGAIRGMKHVHGR